MIPSDTYFAWSPDYNTGIKAIDDQHRVLVNTLNRLAAAVSKNEGDKVVVGILDALMSYTRTHFVLEERLMQQAKYNDLEAHKKGHREFIELLDQLHEKSLSKDEAVYHEMMDFLKTWLTEHIQGVDTKYSTALKQSGFSVAEWEREASTEFRLESSEKRPWWRF